MFDKSYPLMSARQLAMFPLAGVLLPLLMYLALGSMDPSLTIRCERSAPGSNDARCVARESTFVSSGTDVGFPLAGTTIETESNGRARSFRIVPATGPLEIGARVTVTDGRTIRNAVAMFATSSTETRMTVRGGFSGTPFFVLGPIAFLLMLGPVFAFGGTIRVKASASELSVQRDRWLFEGTPWKTALNPTQKVSLEAAQYGGRYRSQGFLWVIIDKQRTQLEGNAAFAVLEMIADELNAYLPTRGANEGRV